MKMKQGNAKNKKFTAIAWVMAVLVLVAIMPINLLFDKLNLNLDFSPNSLYSLTETTTEYLEANNDKHVKLYLLAKMDDIHEDKEMMALYRALQQYDSYDCIELIDIDPDTNPTILKELNPDGYFKLTTGDFLIKCEETGAVKRLSGKIMYSFQYDESGAVISASFNAENYITGAIKSVIDGEFPMLYFLTGHGEKPLADYTQFQANLINYNYRAQELNLMTAEAVPDDAKILVIAAPKTDISDDEAKKLNDFLDKGGNVSFLMSPNVDPVSYTNIERILTDFCLGMDYDRIYETDDERHVSGNPYMIQTELVTAPEEEGHVDLTSGLMYSQSGMYPFMPASRSFYTIYGTNYGSLTIDTLMTTASTAVGEVYGGTDADPDEIKGKEMILSAYSTDKSRNDAKVVVMGNAEFIDDENVQQPHVAVSVYLYLSTITWMYSSDVDMSIANKDKTYDYLTINSEEAANRTLAIFIGAPILVAAFGVFVWWRRKSA